MNRRRLGILLAALGVLLVAYSATVVLWRDPATDLYARWKQHTLSEDLDEAFAEQEPIVAAPAGEPGAAPARARRPSEEEQLVAEKLAVAAAANERHERLELGQALGRLTVPRMGLKTVFVHGTRWGPISRGARATIRRPRCPESAGRWPSPATGPPSARRSGTSTA